MRMEWPGLVMKSIKIDIDILTALFNYLTSATNLLTTNYTNLNGC
jgi:hypothetical protein